MTIWIRRIAGAAGIVATALGAICALGEARPLAAIIDTRSATLAFGMAAAVLGLAFRRRLRIVVTIAGAVLVAIAATWYWRYAAIPVTFTTDVTLRGTLYRPRGAGRLPVVIFIHGSGRETRRESRHYAQLLVRHGIAALTYDKRGSGQSGGSTWSVGYDGYARDAVAAMRYAASRSDLDPARIVLQGQSEAEWVLPIAVATGPPVRAVVMTSASMMTPADQVLFQTGAQLRKSRYSETVIARAMSLQRRVLEYQRSGIPSPGLDSELRQSAREAWFPDTKLPDRLWPIVEYRWWRSVMDFDARPYWRQVHVPVLAFSGMLDEKTEWRQCQERLRAVLAEGRNQNFTGYLLPRTEHGMIVWCLGDRVPPPCWPEQLPSLLTSWLQGLSAVGGAK